MKSLTPRLAVGLVTFAVGVGLTLLAFGRPAQRAVVSEARGGAAGLTGPACGPAPRRRETPEGKAVRLAEEFVARNGYTDVPPDRENLSRESIEWSADVEKVLGLRRDSLERKAYGVRYAGRMGRPGWTVVFRYGRKYGGAADGLGRAVTMDGDFGNLRVEHKDFFLKGIEKKL